MTPSISILETVLERNYTTKDPLPIDLESMASLGNLLGDINHTMSSFVASNEAASPVIPADNSPKDASKDGSSMESTQKDPDESFESSTAVIDEANQTASSLLMGTATTTTTSEYVDICGQGGDGPITAEEAVTLWKRLGKMRIGKAHRSERPPLQKEGLQARPVKITVESTSPIAALGVQDTENLAVSPPPRESTVVPPQQQQQHHTPKDIFEAMEEICGLDEESSKSSHGGSETSNADEEPTPGSVPTTRLASPPRESRNSAAASLSSEGGDVLERVLDSLCGADGIVSPKNNQRRTLWIPEASNVAALVTPTHNDDTLVVDVDLDDLVPGDVYADEERCRAMLGASRRSNRTSSFDVFSNEFASDDHPQNPAHYLLNQFAELCEPPELPNEAKTEPKVTSAGTPEKPIETNLATETKSTAVMIDEA